MNSHVYECLLTCIWQSSSFYYCMEVTDGPNECDQAALGSPHHFFFWLHVVYGGRREKGMPSLWTPSDPICR